MYIRLNSQTGFRTVNDKLDFLLLPSTASIHINWSKKQMVQCSTQWGLCPRNLRQSRHTNPFLSEICSHRLTESVSGTFPADHPFPTTSVITLGGRSLQLNWTKFMPLTSPVPPALIAAKSTDETSWLRIHILTSALVYTSYCWVCH